MKDPMPNNNLEGVIKRLEIEKILLQDNPHMILSNLRESGKLKELLPEVDALYNCIQSRRFHAEGNVFNHTMAVMLNAEAIVKDYTVMSPMDSRIMLDIFWAVLFHDIGKPDTAVLNKHYDVSNPRHEKVGADIFLEKLAPYYGFETESIERIHYLILNHMKYYELKNMSQKKARAFVSSDYFSELTILCVSDSYGSTPAKEEVGNIGEIDSIVKYALELQREINEEKKYPKLISGSSLLFFTNIPKQEYKKIINEIRLMQLNGIIKTTDDALSYVSETYDKKD